MKISYLIFCLFAGISFSANASDYGEYLPGFHLYNTVKNTEIKNGEASITLHFSSSNFNAIPPGYQTVIYYSVNELTDTLFLDATFSYKLQLQAKKTVFKFWAGPGYTEVITDTIHIENQTTSDAQINFLSENQLIEVYKPVIYLQSPVQLDFSLQVNPTNAFTFTYPTSNGKWAGTLYPTGEIEIKGQKYPYLFWDSKQAFQLKKQSNGYHVPKNEVVSFLEKQLSNVGFNSTEKADFITFWGPRLNKYESVFIQFYLQEDCNQFATLACEPKPTSVNRLYIGFCEWNDALLSLTHPIELTAFKRSGFNLLEWGGFELKPIEL